MDHANVVEDKGRLGNPAQNEIKKTYFAYFDCVLVVYSAFTLYTVVVGMRRKNVSNWR